MTAKIDTATAMRPGEELDVEKLTAFLREKLPEASGPVRVTQFPGGHSNLTYLVEVGDRELILRRPPFGNRVKTAHDMGREFTVLSHLAPVYPLAPRPLAYSDDPEVLGAPFYVMERVRGVILRRKLPEGVTLDEETARKLSEALVDRFVDLHAVDFQAAGLGDLGRPEGYVERQVKGWTERYEKAKTDEIPAMGEVARWLAEKMGDASREVRAAVIHNDYKYDNLVLDPDALWNIRGVLDWEMATVGDPLMDLGTLLAWWVEANDSDELRAFAFGPTFVPGSLGRREIVRRYEEKSGRTVVDPVFFYAFALFKNAGVAQQIYWRFVQGHTKDPRFGAFGVAVRILAQAAQGAIDRGTI